MFLACLLLSEQQGARKSIVGQMATIDPRKGLIIAAFV
jgi:hypothetical protein